MHLSSLAGVLALVLSTAASAQSITQKPVTGADRKKATQPTAAKPATDADTSAASPPVVASPTTAQPAAPVSKGQTQAVTPQTTSTRPATTAPDEAATPQSAAPGQAGTTPGQQQSSPGEASQLTPAQTGTTPSGQPVPADQAQANQVAAATEADAKAGAQVFDQKGGLVGTVDSVSAKGVVVNTGKAKAEIPLASFGKNDKGLVMSMTKAELEAASAKAAPPKAAPPPKKK
jgi:hypothetical protein